MWKRRCACKGREQQGLQAQPSCSKATQPGPSMNRTQDAYCVCSFHASKDMGGDTVARLGARGNIAAGYGRWKDEERREHQGQQTFSRTFFRHTSPRFRRHITRP